MHLRANASTVRTYPSVVGSFSWVIVTLCYLCYFSCYLLFPTIIIIIVFYSPLFSLSHFPPRYHSLLSHYMLFIVSSIYPYYFSLFFIVPLSYRQFRKMYGILSAIYHARRDNNMPDIKFGVLEYRQQTAPIVASLGINHVPMVMLFKPHSDQPIIADLQAGLPPFLQQQLGLELNWNDVSGVDPTLLK